MPRNTAISPESFDEILDWLDPDREMAGQKYVQLRHDLARLFMWGRCADLEGLTDEVFDRVARKVHEVKPTYVGDPRLYFRAVANNVIKENFKKTRTYASLDEVDLRPQNPAEIAENTEEREECLQSCLQQLTDEKRKLILAYYAKEKQEKIDHRHELAQRLNISLENLRVRVFRIRAALEKCVESCLDRNAQPK